MPANSRWDLIRGFIGLIQWVQVTRSLKVKQPKNEANQLLASITEVKRQLKCTSALPCTFIARTGQLNFIQYFLTMLSFMRFIKKVKVTLVQALKLRTGPTAHRGNRGIALLFHDQRH